MYAGIDYGRGITNIDHATGIRFGVIPQNSAVLQAWADSSEAQYGDPTCLRCGNTASASDEAPESVQAAEWFEGKDFYCEGCERSFWSDDAYVYEEEPLGFTFEADGYKAESDPEGDIFITLSPFYTFAPFCSPCAPGACYLPEEPIDIEGLPRAYCFGHEWFEDGKAPYRVFRVSDNAEVFAE